jgi:hypothetical protein
MAMPFSAAGRALGLGMAGMGGFGFGDQQESEEERRKRLQQFAQQRGLLTQNASPAASSLFGGGLSGIGGTGRLF